jgi:hypothetical protein
MKTDEQNDDWQHENELLDRASAALRDSSSFGEVPQAVIDATTARLRSLTVSQPSEDRTPPRGRFHFRQVARAVVAIALMAALLFWLTAWPGRTSALAQALTKVQTAKSVVFDFRAKVGNQAEQVSRIKILGDVIRQESANSANVFLVNHRTGETLNLNTARKGPALAGHLPDRRRPNADFIAQLLGVVKVANERLADETVKGVACLVFRGHDFSPLAIAGPGERKLWLDAKTKLPIRIEARWRDRERDPEAYVILENVKWNEELDPSQFDMQKIAREFGASAETAAGSPQSGKPNHGPEKGASRFVAAPEDGSSEEAHDKRRLEVRVMPPSFPGSPAESRDRSGLRLIGLAIHRYLDRHQQRLPPAAVMGPDGKTPHSWRVEILPFLGKGGEALYKQYRLDEPWDSPANKRVLAQMPDVFRSADDDLRSNNSSFFALVGPGTVFDGNQGIKIDQIFDGTTATILLVEAKRNIPWTKPEDIPYDRTKPLPAFGGFAGDKFLALFADCVTVRQLSLELGEKTLRGLIGRDDRTAIDLDSLGR